MHNILTISGGSPGSNGVGTNKQEIRLTPYAAGHIPDLSFLYAGLPQYASAPSKPARQKLAGTMSANATDFDQVLDVCREVYRAKSKTSLAMYADEEAFIQECETMRKYFMAASGQ
jgi:hypothetical protein